MQADLGRREAVFAKLKGTAAAMVQLNVGGTLFTTSTTTMMQANEGSPLEILFCGQHGAAAEGEAVAKGVLHRVGGRYVRPPGYAVASL